LVNVVDVQAGWRAAASRRLDAEYRARPRARGVIKQALRHPLVRPLLSIAAKSTCRTYSICRFLSQR
jgi:hypothetical protein